MMLHNMSRTWLKHLWIDDNDNFIRETIFVSHILVFAVATT